jgi:hypothetical protein
MKEFRQSLKVAKTNPFVYQQRNQKARHDVLIEVVNTVFKVLPVNNFAVENTPLDKHPFGSKRSRVIYKRARFRNKILYPSIKKEGIIDPLVVQYVINVPENLGGWFCWIGNNRLRVIKEYPDLKIEEIPCFVINISGIKDNGERPIEGKLINKPAEAKEYYGGKPQYLMFQMNKDGFIIDVKRTRFM